MGKSAEPTYLKTVDALNERYLIDVPGVQEIWLIRHADAYHGLRQSGGDAADPPLSPLGRSQAATLAHRLAETPFRAIWSSPVLRAAQTARVIADRHGLRVRTDARLREIRTQWDEEGTSTLRPQGDYPFPEPEAEVADRMHRVCEAVLAELPAGEQAPVRAAVVGHTAAMLLHITHTLGLRWGQLPTMLCLTSVSVIAHREGRTVVRSFGDVSHLATERSPAVTDGNT